jgi:hypothetical protein
MRELAATVPARSAHAFLAHPTRFERVTIAFRLTGASRYILRMKLDGQVYSVIPEVIYQDILKNVKQFILD